MTLFASTGLPVSTNTLVIGAGAAGLAAAFALEQDVIVLEARDLPGGLCDTIELQGAFFDLGGHSFHSPHASVRDLIFDLLPMYEQKRQARCFVQGEMISYPFQKHFAQLNQPEIVEECRRFSPSQVHNIDCEILNFGDYLINRFGEGICRNFLLPYNRKLWGSDLSRLSANWVSERIEGSGSQKGDFSAGKRVPLQDDSIVAYPAQGGFSAITSALAQRVADLRCGNNLVSVNILNKTATTSDGTVYNWKKLITTIPLNLFCEKISEFPRQLSTMVSQLEFLPLHVVFVVLNHSVETDIQRIYCSEENIQSHKIVINHNSSEYLRSLPHSGISAEIALPPERLLNLDDVESHFVKSLLEMRMIKSGDEVIATKRQSIRYGYPVPTHSRESVVAAVKSWLGERDIYCLGRFGEWDYINSDEAIARGLLLGRALNAG